MTRSRLTLGWRVDSSLAPMYWSRPGAVAGKQPESELVQVEAKEMAHHTAVIAQSGSGKSFFLGRLIEEIVLETRARCVVLDPNADFRRIFEAADKSLWDNPQYDLSKRRGFLPTEESQDAFLKRWKSRSIRVSIGIKAASLLGTPSYAKLEIPWANLTMSLFEEDLEPMQRSELFHAHGLVEALAKLLKVRLEVGIEPENFLQEAEEIFEFARSETDKQKIVKRLSEKFPITAAITAPPARPAELPWTARHDDAIQALRDRASAVRHYVPEDVQRFYFGRVKELKTSGMIGDVPKVDGDQFQLHVLDLPSLPHRRARIQAVNACITTVWDEARTEWAKALQERTYERSPTFIVVDEAHNLMPAVERDKGDFVLREQFRTIAAEGRKYGLFLILVSQRPDKLDPLVLSEIENKAIMRLGSEGILQATQRLLGLDDVSPRLLQRCLQFDTGRVLLAGSWLNGGAETAYCAARRTVEAGADLPETWTTPPADGIAGAVP